MFFCLAVVRKGVLVERILYKINLGPLQDEKPRASGFFLTSLLSLLPLLRVQFFALHPVLTDSQSLFHVVARPPVAPSGEILSTDQNRRIQPRSMQRNVRKDGTTG